jgi:Ca2+-binding RTX toxin-like protein
MNRGSISGTKIGGEFTVNTFLTGQQTLSSVTADADGGFTVSWQSDDGTVRSRSFDNATIIDGTAGNDSLTGDAKANLIHGYAGDDTGPSYVGSTAAVKVNLASNANSGGYAQDDLLSGIENVVGGAGNDMLFGGQGADEFRFGRTDGADTINAFDTDGGADQLAVGAGVTTDQLWFAQTGNDLVMTIIGTSDSMTVQDWYSGANQKLDRVQLSTGTYAETSDIEALRSAMAAFSPPPLRQTTLDPSVAQSLAPALVANWH